MTERPSGGSETALDRLLSEGLAGDLYTGAAAAIGSAGGVERVATVGRPDPARDQPVTPDTPFDLASVTKAVATAPVVLSLVEAGKIALSEPIGEYLEPVAGTTRGELPVWKYLTHTTGLEPYHYDPAWTGPADARTDIYETDLHDPGGVDEYEYSCLNYVHLVDAVRRITGDTFADLVARHVTEPAGAATARIGPLPDDAGPVAVTYDHQHADATLRGAIHDPIARALAGESGNAGLFGSVTDVSRLARAFLPADTGTSGRAAGSGESPRVLAPPTLSRARRNWLGDDRRPHGLGWRLALESYPAANWSTVSYGHTGYTGTSVWLDPEFDRFAVLLTNAVYHDAGEFLAFRERFHGVVAGGRY